MDLILNEAMHLLTPAGLLALANIILIDIVMSGDNAILIGMATSKLQGKDRKKAIFFGITLATVLRIVLAFFAVFLLGVVGIKLAGGLLLLYVVWKFYRELRSTEHTEHHIDAKKSGLLAAITTIIVADFSMSLDNVLAVAGASHGNIVNLALGLVISIILMAFASNMIAHYLDRYPQIQWVGLFVILFVAVGMIHEGSFEVGEQMRVNILPFVMFIIGGVMVVLQQKYIRPVDEVHLREWIAKNAIAIIIAGLVLSTLFVFFGGVISEYILSHPIALYSTLCVLLFVALELVAIKRKK